VLGLHVNRHDNSKQSLPPSFDDFFVPSWQLHATINSVFY
jgi:hypothetical protein